MDLVPPKKIVIITSGQPSLNPRLVKEADALAEDGHNVKVIYAYWNIWGTSLDKNMLPCKKWLAIKAGGSPVDMPLIYFLSRLIFKATTWFTRLTGLTALANFAIARSSYFLTQKAKKHQADLYIGHNLGALPAVVIAAKKYGSPCGFDAEDFHRNEISNDRASAEVKLKTLIENKYIPQLQYLTVSSPLIGKEYHRLYPQIKQATILNSFTHHPDIKPAFNTDSPLKLCWFSQTTGLNRGLENIISALKLLADQKFELHLLGDVNNTVRDGFTTLLNTTQSDIYFYKPIPAYDIPVFVAQFDIGVASENHHPFNRDICLTNKIFTYIQAGLPILASNTSAQTAFFKQYDVAGKIYINNDPASIAGALMFYQKNRPALQQAKKHNSLLGQTTLNWENDKKKLLAIINQTLNVE